ncbi:hypothetical protein DNTS_016215, partial [Danionella cerebrum]
MGDDNVVARLGSIKALLGIVAGAGASYGMYKLVFGRTGDGGVGRRKSAKSEHVEPGSLLAKVSGFKVVSKNESGESVSKPRHLSMLLSLLQSSPNSDERRKVLITLGNAAAFTVNQDLLREFGGLHIIAGYLSDTSSEIRVQALNALNNLSMNILNQEQLKLIEMSPVNSDLQLAALRLLTNLSVTDSHQHLMKGSITLLLSLLVVSSELLQIQVLKVLVNLSSNPDLMDDIVQAQVAEALRGSQDSLFCVLLDSSSQLHQKLPLLLSHPEEEVKTQVARLL